MKIIKAFVFIILISILSFGTILPLFHQGFFTFHDDTQVVRVYEMFRSLQAGMFPVRWVMDLGYGYGYPLFNFYAPLPYYLASIFGFLGFDLLFSTKIMIAIGAITSGVSMFFLARKYFGNAAGILSGVIYAYFPYHAVNIYVRGAVGEFFAYAFLPIVFLGVFNLYFSKEKKIFSAYNLVNSVIVSVGIFLVSLSHNLSIFMVLLLLIPLSIVSLFIKKQKMNFLILLTCSVLFGLALSAFYILPAFLEMGYTNVSSQIGGGADFRDHFVCVGQLWNSIWGFGGSTQGCLDGMSFRLGKTNLLILVLSISIFVYTIILKKKIKDEEHVGIVAFAMLMLSFFLMLPVSKIIWETTPFMQYLQYPWRFLNFTGLFLAFIAGYSVFKIVKINKKAGLAICLILIGLTVYHYINLFVPQAYNSFAPEYYTNKDFIRFNVSKISDEYMPIGFRKPEVVSDVPVSEVELLKTTGNIGVLISKPGQLKTAYEATTDAVIHVNTAYYPSWKAFLNGKEVPIMPADNGMNISVPKGKGQLEVKLGHTETQNTGNFITIISFFAFIVGIIAIMLKQKKHHG